MDPKPVLIDCDPGIDDSVAILFALASPALSIKAITTVSGNLLANQCSVNARKILKLSGRPDAYNIPVAKGRKAPLVRAYPKDPFSHGANGLGELNVPDSGIEEDARFAADVIIETANIIAEDRKGQKLTVLCLGPLTNLALAVMKDPALPQKIEAVYFIGGSFGFHTTGTVRSTGTGPTSEWNVVVDPEAANIVFAAGFNLTALGLDVVTRPDVEFDVEHLSKLRAASGAGNVAAKYLLGVVDWGKTQNFETWCTTIDSTAVAVCLDESIVKTKEIRCAVETKGELTLGQTVVDRREKFAWTHLPKIKAASDIDAKRFLDLLVNSICSES
jgi:inosine-uridine nucleoside N-ribohydrolase